MVDITLTAFLTDVTGISTAIFTTSAQVIQLFMQPPLNIFVGAGVVFLGVKLARKLLKAAKSTAN